MDASNGVETMADVVRYKALIGMEGACLMKIRIWTGPIAGLFFALASLAAFAAPPSAGQEEQGLAAQGVGAEGDTPLTFLSSEVPLFAFLKDGKQSGFAVEILREIMRMLGRADRIEFDDWQAVYQRGLTEPGTVLLPPSRMPECEKLFKWVGPLVPEKLVLFGRRDSDLSIGSIEDATDYTLIWPVGVAALVVVLFVLLWNWRLKKEIVERKRAEKAAETANRAKSTFLASMSHELRTPLNTVLGFTNIVAKSDNLSAEDRENLAIVRRSGEHLLTLINDILDLSRIEAGKVGLNEEVFDLHHLLDDLNLMFEQNTRKKGLLLEFVRKPNLPRRIKADQVKLRQVLINLIGNALKFTRQGGVTITADFQGPSAQNELKTGGGRLSFAIEDTGPGIAEADFEKIFNPFMQTETGRRSNQGAGLGLSISRRFVRAMGGDISVESAVGKGSVFRFRIEWREPSDMEHSKERESPPAVGPAPDSPGCRILIVDDVSVNRFLLVSILGPGDFEVREAEDGRQAVEIWRRWRPRLIWMDIRMPVLDGYEATRIIRDEERNSEEGLVPTVIVAVSAGVFEEQRDRALKAGCDDFVPKPLDDSVVFDKMRKLLGIERERENHVDERHGCEKRGQKDHGRRKESRPDGGGAELAPGALAGLPADWLETLRRGARRADFALIAEVVAQIRERDAATAGALGRLADDFRYDEILALLPGTDRKTSD